MQTELRTALYGRFSHDENYDGDSNSIAHQKELLAEYANSNGFTNYQFYIDDGFTGVNFERPAFKQMMADIEQGLIGTVIVKDLSRFGRNYLLVGQYTEMIFPQYGVRFIAIGDSIDTAEGLNDLMPFNNLINEWYSRDISRKMRAMIQQKGNSGKRLCTRPIYGYKLDPDDKNKWVIDEYAAGIIRRIYDLYISGTGVMVIAKILTAEKVLRPSAYLHQETRYGYSEKCKYDWNETTVTTFLTKPEYCGDTINFRTHRVSYKNKKMVKNPQEDWVIYKDTHPAIIDRETFEKAQEIYDKRFRRPTYPKEPSIFNGYLNCIDCKAKMRAHKGGGRHRALYYQCSTYLRRNREFTCESHAVREPFIISRLIDELNKILEFAHSDNEKFKALVYDTVRSNGELSQQEIKNRTAEYKARIEEINKYIQGLFESKVCGEIDGEMFGHLSKGYADEKSALNDEIAKLIVSESTVKDSVRKVNRFLEAVGKYERIDEITDEVLSAFIDRIEVSKSIEGGQSKYRHWDLDIYYVGVGMLIVK